MYLVAYTNSRAYNSSEIFKCRKIVVCPRMKCPLCDKIRQKSFSISSAVSKIYINIYISCDLLALGSYFNHT